MTGSVSYKGKGDSMHRRYGCAAFYVCLFVLAAAAGNEDKKTVLTFLDTLNNGRELRFGAADTVEKFARIAPAETGLAEAGDAPADVNAAERREAGVVPSRFVVQVLAATSQQQVKLEKRNVAAKIKLPLSISYDAPYYKLYIGDCRDRAEAENVLAQVKKSGYNDAWIVRLSAAKQ